MPPSSKTLTDAELALQLAVIIHDGALPDEFATVRDFFAAIGVATSPACEQWYADIVRRRTPVANIDLVRMIADITGWNRERAHLAAMSAVRRGWLKIAGYGFALHPLETGTSRAAKA